MTPGRSASIALIVLVSALLGLAEPAGAGLTTSALRSAEVSPPTNARVPLALGFTDEHGQPRTLADALGNRPSLLIFADYTCQTLCGPILSLASTALEKTPLRPGRDYSLIAIGLDPKDSLDSARRMKAAQIGNKLSSTAVFLTGTDETIRKVTDAVGYRYVYDALNDQFAHPAVAFVFTGDGRLVRVLSGLGMDPNDLRLALVEAGEGRVGGLIDHIRLLCYGFDPAAGVYTVAVGRWLSVLGTATVAMLAALIGYLLLRERSRSPRRLT